jgi:hypothetical protein
MRWFKHDSNANTDAKLKRVRIKYGLEGYGLYWYCLELIAGDVSKEKITFELEHDAEIIAYDTGLHYERVQEMMTFMVNLGLFEQDEGMITCIKMAQRMDQSMTSNPEMRKIIERFKSNNHDLVMTPSAEPMQDKTRLDEINKEPVKRKRFIPPAQSEVFTYMVEKGLDTVQANVESVKFWSFYDSKNWKVGKNPMAKWKSSVSGWIGRMDKPQSSSSNFEGFVR